MVSRSEAGSYLGRTSNTDTKGEAEFLLPDESFKFRVDYDGDQYWSNIVNVEAHGQLDIELALE